VRVVVPDPIELEWEGEWDADATYDPGDVIAHEGSSYRARVETTGDDPAESPDEWEIVALRGADGPAGPAGPAGPPGSGASEEFDFPTPDDEWEIEHNRNTYPNVLVLDTLDRPGHPFDIEYPDLNTVIIKHEPPMAGKAILNY
jgi:hypothetical protein